MGKRRTFSKEFKSKVALAALKEEKTLAELSSMYGVHSNMINRWKQEAVEHLQGAFSGPASNEKDKDELIEELYKKIGKLNVENEWIKKKLPI